MSALMFQEQVGRWMAECFGADIAGDRVERNHRFTEEALELVQACGMTRDEAHALVEYVFTRPAGEAKQEVGGVVVTLAALCSAQHPKISMNDAARVELERVKIPAVMERIRAKQAAKPKFGPLPGTSS